jgi:hypothetical protein
MSSALVPSAVKAALFARLSTLVDQLEGGDVVPSYVAEDFPFKAGAIAVIVRRIRASGGRRGEIYRASFLITVAGVGALRVEQVADAIVDLLDQQPLPAGSFTPLDVSATSEGADAFDEPSKTHIRAITVEIAATGL